MGFTGSIVLFFVGILAIVMIHEAGHYLMARGFGFRVLEYFVGFGPRLWSFRRGEIEYGLKAIPAGGYVKIAGMNPLVDDVPPGDEDRAYYAKPVWQRSVVILAGPLSHFLVAALLFALIIGIWGSREIPTIDEVERTVAGRPAPAFVAGLRPGDVIVRVGDVEDPTPTDIRGYTQDHLGEVIPFGIQRGDQQLEVGLTPVVETIDGVEIPRIGVLLGPTQVGPVASVVGGAEEVATLTKESIFQIGRIFGPDGIVRTAQLLFTDDQRAQTDPVSVVGIGQTVGTIGEQGEWEAFLFTFAYVTLFIGLINLIPLPPLDGGHLAVLLIERFTGKPVDMKRLIPVSVSVLVFLVLFTMANVTLDIVKPVPGP